jgi:hypothetical protein
MASKTTTFIAQADNKDGFDTRASSSTSYSHALIVGKPGERGAISWHKTEAAAVKAAQAAQGHWTKPEVVEVTSRNGSKVTVERQLRMERESNDRVKAKAAPIKAARAAALVESGIAAQDRKAAKKLELTGEAKKAYDERVARTAADQAKPSTRTLPPVEAKAPKAKAAPSASKAELMAANPGYVISTKSRSSKTVAVLIDARAGHKLALDESKGRWQTICLDHEATVAHPGQRPARDALGHPELWCPKCKKAAKA